MLSKERRTFPTQSCAPPECGNCRQRFQLTDGFFRDVVIQVELRAFIQRLSVGCKKKLRTTIGSRFRDLSYKAILAGEDIGLKPKKHRFLKHICLVFSDLGWPGSKPHKLSAED
jgi:hypothetical protein